MKILGYINERAILYCNIRLDSNWFLKLPHKNWIAFTVADREDKELLYEAVIKCLDNGVSYTCSVGELASYTDDCFDGEIVLREIQKEEKTGELPDFDKTPMTTFHQSFDEGFLFATKTANATINDQYLETDKVVCIDFTKQGVEEYVINLIDKINKG